MSNFLGRRSWLRALLAGLLLVCAVAVNAQDEPGLDMQSPSVMAIRKSLADRYVVLKAHFQEGVIGFTHDGLIAMREAGQLSPEIRVRVEQLVMDDNKDRATMYREIARANGRPDWESKIQNVFAARWFGRAPVGWYYRDSSGHWLKKPTPVA
jgi:uncharacterized protein YdbL (DUF1318 family)